MEALNAGEASDFTEEQLSRSVDRLLRRVYAYISWGIRIRPTANGIDIRWRSSVSVSPRSAAAACSTS